MSVGDANVELPSVIRPSSVDHEKKDVNEKVVDDKGMVNVENHVNEAVSSSIFYSF